MANYWHPDTCSEDTGCIMQISEGMDALSAIARTCTGHAATQWGRAVAMNMQNPHAAQPGDQGRFNAILAQNKRAEHEPPGQAGLGVDRGR